jgi:uncharacterized protein (TIGR02145 family)
MKKKCLFTVLFLFIPAFLLAWGIQWDNKNSVGKMPGWIKWEKFVCGKDVAKDSYGNTYKTVRVGKQCWLASNLNVGVKLASIADEPTRNGIVEKWCYNNDDANCVTYGGLYGWDEAMNYSTAEGSRGICPVGFHIPSKDDWHVLEDHLKDEGESCIKDREYLWDGDHMWDCASAGTKLKSGGSSGLNIPLGGFRRFDGVEWVAKDIYSMMYSSSPRSDGGDWKLLYAVIDWQPWYNVRFMVTGAHSTTGLAIRCVGDKNLEH